MVSNGEKRARTLLPASLLLPLRVFMGVTFLYAGVQHLTDPSYFNSSKTGYIGHLIAQYAVGSPIHDFLLGFVAPNAVMFGYVVGVGESLIGIAVLLGFFYKVAAFMGLVLNFTFFLSATWNAFPYYFGSDIVFVFAWLTLLLTGPQVGLSLDSSLARRAGMLGWLVNAPVKLDVVPQKAPEAKEAKMEVPVSVRAKLYPKQVFEVNRAFDRIEQQFLPHQETQTMLELVRGFIISLGADRNDAAKILDGLRNVISRSAWEENQQ
jgi:uncharacterized membrane protein YphA (DoxX/SURF4 family)